MIEAKKTPLEIVKVPITNGIGTVLRFTPKSSYADSFGYEWKNYSRTYGDKILGVNLSGQRLEHLLGFPSDFLKDLTVLEVGCGAGRFTEQLVKYAKQVVAFDLSEAVYVNSALGAPNLLALQADIYDFPALSESIGIVICRGIIQHTPDPKKTIRSLFDFVPVGGLVVFDVYKKTGKEWRNVKYFWRPIVQKWWTIDQFDAFINRHGKLLYRMHHFVHRVLNSFKPLRRLIAKTPLYLHMNWDNQYSQVEPEQRLAIFKNELIDMFYSHYDQPMTPAEILNTLGSFGQKPYSYDLERNIFRCQKTIGTKPLKLGFTKNGVVSTPLV